MKTQLSNCTLFYTRETFVFVIGDAIIPLSLADMAKFATRFDYTDPLRHEIEYQSFDLDTLYPPLYCKSYGYGTVFEVCCGDVTLLTLSRSDIDKVLLLWDSVWEIAVDEFLDELELGNK